MAKRLTDTEIWEQDWYIELPSKYKLLWNFIKDKCDDCGVWRPNKSLLQRIIGEPINLDEFMGFINVGGKERIRTLPNGRWFIIEYFFFQYGDKFNPKSPVHRGALKRLLQNNVHPKELSYLYIGELVSVELQTLKEIGYQKGTDSILKAYGYDSDRDKVKDKDKAQDNTVLEYQEISFDKTSLNPKMVEVFKRHYPHYPVDEKSDFGACLQIAYLIAKQKKWTMESVLNENLQNVLDAWEKIVQFSTTDKWYSTRSISDFLREFQRIVQSMTAAAKPKTFQKQEESKSAAPRLTRL